MNFSNLLAKKLTDTSQAALVAQFIDHLRRINMKAESGFLFGSSARGDMTTWSDLDVLFLFDSLELLRESKKIFYRNPFIACPVDAVFMLKSEYLSRADIGGIPFIAAREGLRIDW